ncbi:SIMPL domain-containing protein [Prolixibacteraceae bacterium Z1-6]|uniref:SIMPL domain-containing protein n=1 Tax=Draconibacterium aestuarii TaxID=2998507 RepID=A0A9X3FCX1_9BACT|nr:SIMPL domain-containing protein [Prolixibacteraceae bacterium Z1-6]
MKNSAAVILGAFIVVAFSVLGWYFKESKRSQQNVKVVGYAIEEFESNLVKWSVGLSERVPMNGTQEGYRIMAKKLDEFERIWKQTGIKTDEFKVFPINLNREYGNGGQVGYNLTQRIYVVSSDIGEIEKLAINPKIFVEKGVIFDNSLMEFFSTELEEIKKELLGAATQNARERADLIVSTTDLKVDKLLSARSGVFQITEPYSTEVAGYGIHNTSSSTKNIKVTVSAEFLLR